MTTRRRFISTAAALPALAAPVVASAGAPDPIFAAIEALKVASANYWADGFGDMTEAEQDRLCDANSNAEAKVLHTIPATVAGLCALCQFADEYAAFLRAKGAPSLADATYEAGGCSLPAYVILFRTLATSSRLLRPALRKGHMPNATK